MPIYQRQFSIACDDNQQNWYLLSISTNLLIRFLGISNTLAQSFLPNLGSISRVLHDSFLIYHAPLQYCNLRKNTKFPFIFKRDFRNLESGPRAYPGLANRQSVDIDREIPVGNAVAMAVDADEGLAFRRSAQENIGFQIKYK